MRRTALFPLAFVAVVACSSSSSPGAAGDAGPTPDAFKHDLVFTMKATIPSGKELHLCQLVQVPAGPDINIVGFAHQYTPGSHHFLLYQTTLTSIPSDLTGQYDCTTGGEPIMASSRGIIYGAQVPTGSSTFPEGVAVTVKAGAVLIMNTHYLNAGKKDIDTQVQVGLDLTTADRVKTPGGFFIFYDPFIDVPAHGKASSGGSCAIPSDVNVVSAFSHYHYRGTGMQVWNDPDATTKAATPFYTTDDWEHPAGFKGPTTWKGGSRIRFQCDYDNTSSGDEIMQGPNASTSEMCVLAGLYYPKQDEAFENCHRYSVSGFGATNCSDTATCLQKCPAADQPKYTPTGAVVGPCWEHCVAAACDGAVDNVFPLFGCAGASCSVECGKSSGDCIACLASKCDKELTSCQNQVCAK